MRTIGHEISARLSMLVIAGKVGTGGAGISDDDRGRRRVLLEGIDHGFWPDQTIADRGVLSENLEFLLLGGGNSLVGGV